MSIEIEKSSYISNYISILRSLKNLEGTISDLHKDGGLNRRFCNFKVDTIK